LSKVREKLLFLSAFLPSPASRQAGQKTAFRHLRWLAERHDVWFAGFRSEADNPADEAGLRALCREVHLLPVTRARRIAGVLRRPGLPLVVAARWSAALAGTVRRLATEHAFVRAHAEWSQMAEYLELLPAVPERWVSAHDVVGQFCERAAAGATGWRRRFWRWETGRARRWEAARYGRAGTVLVQSGKDAELLRGLLAATGTRIRVIPPHFERFRPRLRTADGPGPTLLFWGALGRTENSEAALWLGRDLLPALAAVLPGARLLLAGSNPPPAVQALASDRVTVTGFVAEPQAVFDQADVAVLPLFRGAGIKVKVLECLAAGLPVLTGAIGAEGIVATAADGLAVQEPDPAAYAATVAGWWRTPGQLEARSRGALAWGERLAGGDRAALFP
jgi:glycosyltransferase involved in cell wall biosynthesis